MLFLSLRAGPAHYGLPSVTTAPVWPPASELVAPRQGPANISAAAPRHGNLDTVYLTHHVLSLLIALLGAFPGIMCGSVFLTACASLAVQGCRSLVSAIFDRGAAACLGSTAPLGRCISRICSKRVASVLVKETPAQAPLLPSTAQQRLLLP